MSFKDEGYFDDRPNGLTGSPPAKEDIELEGQIDDIMLKPAGWQLDDYIKAKKQLKALITSREAKARLSELSKVWGGMNTAAGIRDGGYQSRNLNLDDLRFWLHNRRRVLKGKKAHTPDEWFEAER